MFSLLLNTGHLFLHGKTGSCLLNSAKVSSAVKTIINDNYYHEVKVE